MIVDASAILSVAFEEVDADSFRTALLRSGSKRMSAVNYLEAALRLDNFPEGDARDLDVLLATLGVVVAPVTAEQARLARDAHRRFGRGRHPAGLNLGDCFAYALAADSGEALLYKGDDFARTDVRAAL